MREVTLSDHTADQVRQGAEKREVEFNKVRQVYERKLEERVVNGEELRQRSAGAWQRGQYGQWVVSLVPRLRHALSVLPAIPSEPKETQEEQIWNAGNKGEQRVTNALRGTLSDDWILVSGYRNPAGEIDKLLLSPSGILAIEVKFINGDIYCDGDTWWCDKYDNYGNLVKNHVDIKDKRGRGPSAQVNAAADRLERFIAKRSKVERIRRAVVFSHNNSILVQVNNQTVDIVTTVDSVAKQIIEQMQGSIAGVSSDDLLYLIRRDHEFHERGHASKPEESRDGWKRTR